MKHIVSSNVCMPFHVKLNKAKKIQNNQKIIILNVEIVSWNYKVRTIPYVVRGRRLWMIRSGWWRRMKLELDDRTQCKRNTMLPWMENSGGGRRQRLRRLTVVEDTTTATPLENWKWEAILMEVEILSRFDIGLF